MFVLFAVTGFKFGDHSLGNLPEDLSEMGTFIPTAG